LPGGKAAVIDGVNSGWQGQPLGKGGNIRGGSGGRAVLNLVDGDAIGEGPGTLPVLATEARPARSMLTRWEAVEVEVMERSS
jgi:hypothetical protein